MVRHKDSVVPFILGNLDFPIAAISLQFPKYGCIAKGVDTFIHVRYRVRVLGHHCVQIAVVNAKSESSVLLKDGANQWAPLHLRGLNNVHGEHSIYFLLFKLSCLRSCMVWRCVDWWIAWVYVCSSSIGCCPAYRSKVFVPHTFELCKHVDTYVGICRILNWERKSLAPIDLWDFFLIVAQGCGNPLARRGAHAAYTNRH